MITVEYPPGSSDPIHRDNAHAFVYVLEGSIVMQVRDGQEVTLTPSETFHEGPDDVHIVGRNASKTKPAKFVVFLVKDKGAPVVGPKGSQGSLILNLAPGRSHSFTGLPGGRQNRLAHQNVRVCRPLSIRR